MKIGDFPLVEALIATRNHLLSQRDEGKIRIDIDGRMMDPGFTQEVIPAIRLELGNRVRDIDIQLRGLGIDID